MPALVPTARSVAARVLARVERDSAFAAAALDAEIEKHPQLDARERALLTEIVYGVLRTRAVLLSHLEAHAPRGLPKDPKVRYPLLVAAYQLLLLERIPAHAAVDAAVGEIRAVRGAKSAGFANALLRRVAAGGKVDRVRAVMDSAPPWLLSALEEAVGPEEARALLGDSTTHRVAVRVVAGRPLPPWLESAERGAVSPRARLVPRAGDLRRNPGFAEGAVTIQEEGAQAVALALGVRPGDRVLDACAGRGQKTTLFREQAGDDADVWAVDLHPAKLEALQAEFRRLRLVPPTTRAVDWTLGVGGIPGGFDRVLVDAPCTGSGTLRRRPEIALRLTPEDPARMALTAEAILRRAASLCRPRGRVVFAVCSVLPEETEHVVRRVADALEPAPFDAPELSGLGLGDRTSFRLLPLTHGTDGFFVASFVRR